MTVRLLVNGNDLVVDVPSETMLLGLLRDDIGLTGARFGCGHGACGACYVLVDGEAMPACKVAIEDARDKTIVTVEGLARGEALHPVQQAFVDLDAMQCGYCTSGMIVSAVALLERNPHPTDDDVRTALAGHLCRCGVYSRAIRAVQTAAERIA